MTSRDVFPLPEVDTGEEQRWRGLPLSRSVVRRLQRRRHVDEWLNLGIRALNSLAGCPNNFNHPAAPSVVQQECPEGLRAAFNAVSAPEKILTPLEAWKELQGSSLGYSSSEVGALAVYREGHVALPPVGSVPVELCQELSQEDRRFLESPSDMILDGVSVGERLAQLSLKEPYMDPQLRHHRRKYARFVGELYARNVVSFGSTCKERVGAFFLC